jgi:hypothetical protein
MRIWGSDSSSIGMLLIVGESSFRIAAKPETSSLGGLELDLEILASSFFASAHNKQDNLASTSPFCLAIAEPSRNF